MLKQLGVFTKTKIIVALPIAIISLVACRTVGPVANSLKIDSGIFITTESTNTVPAVMSISGCTATAVSHNTLVTAAHCVYQNGKKSPQVCIRSPGQAMDKCGDVSIPSGYPQREQMRPNDQERENMRLDVAVAIFPANTFKYYFNMYQGQMTKDLEFIMVGYSQDKATQQELQSNGSKRWGKNKINYFDKDNAIISRYGSSAEKVAVSPGDSGGPLFIGCQLAGVASRMGGNKISLHTNLRDSQNQAFFKEMRGKGAAFCGTDMASANECPADGLTKIRPDNNTDFPCAAALPNNPVKGTGGLNNSGGSSSPVSIAVADETDQPAVYISTPANASQPLICKGKDGICNASSSLPVTRVNSGSTDRTFYKLTGNAGLKGGSDNFFQVVTQESSVQKTIIINIRSSN